PDSAPWNDLAGRTIHAIRAADPRRAIMVGGNRYNMAEEMQNLVLPDDPYLVYTFHHYHPMVFTHQRAYWVPALANVPLIDYPGVITDARSKIKLVPHAQIPSDLPDTLILDKNGLVQTLKPAVDFIKSRNALVYCGEFGAIDQAPLESRLNWYRDFIGLLNEYKIGRAVWSYKEMDFGLVDHDGQVISQELIKIVCSR
ncbi:MAG TPA: cellulase family glycosylhydrolase, partial [Anaerolineaceae bacterium]|nr:cellulase family glycosylhydrolase [Anaerolineaceae bacterium]